MKRLNKRGYPARQLDVLLIILLILCSHALAQPSVINSWPEPVRSSLTQSPNPLQSTQQFAADPVYFEYPTGWTVTRDQSNPNLLGFVLQRAGLEGQITIYVNPQQISLSADTESILLGGIRSSILEPLIERFTQAAVTAGGQTQRSPVQTEIGGVSTAGERLFISSAGESGTVDFYAMLLNGRLAIVYFLQSSKTAAQSAPAWELFRRTLRIGVPTTTTARTTSPEPPRETTPQPSLNTLNEGSALINEFYELTQKVVKLRNEGNYKAAIPLAERALVLAEKIGSLNLPAEMRVTSVVGSLNVLAVLHQANGNYQQAEPMLKRALDMMEKLKGPNDPTLVTQLVNLAALYYEMSAYDQAEPLFQRAVNLEEKANGPESPKLAITLNNLALLYDARNDFKQAEKAWQRALAIQEKVLGAEHPDTAVTLNNLGTFYTEISELGRAEQMFRRVLSIYEKASGSDHPNVATALNNLALLYKQKGDYVQAEPLFQRALAIAEKSLGANHPSVANTLDNMALLFYEKGDYARAEPLYKGGLEIRERALGADHPDVAIALSNLALLYQMQNDYAQAETLLERTRVIFEKKFGPDHGQVATALDNLASLYWDQGQYARAEPLAQRALAIRQKIFGPESLEVALSLHNTGQMAAGKGDYARAEALKQQGLRIYQKIYGPNHPNNVTFLASLSIDYLTRGNTAQAIKAQEQANEIRERQIALLLSTGTEEQKRLYMASISEGTEYTLFLHAGAAPQDRQALRLALTTLLRRKGRVLDAMSDQVGALRRHLKPEDRTLLEQLSTARADLATLILKGPGKMPPSEYQERIAKLTAEVERLETQVSTRSTQFRAQAQPVTLERTQQAIPAGAALVEFASYRTYNIKSRKKSERWGTTRYAAYVLRPDGTPAWVDLGEAAPIDQAITTWRGALADPRRTDVQQLARTLDERIMRPVRKVLGDARHLFLSPDGALNLIPFGALMDEQNRYLVETYTITYLSSGRDLLRLTVKAEGRQGPVVLADPVFDVEAGSKTVSA